MSGRGRLLLEIGVLVVLPTTALFFAFSSTPPPPPPETPPTRKPLPDPSKLISDKTFSALRKRTPDVMQMRIAREIAAQGHTSPGALSPLVPQVAGLLGVKALDDLTLCDMASRLTLAQAEQIIGIPPGDYSNGGTVTPTPTNPLYKVWIGPQMAIYVFHNERGGVRFVWRASVKYPGK